jgi:hypothetical protein
MLPEFEFRSFVMPNAARILMPARFLYFQLYKKYTEKMYSVMPV